MGEFKIPSASSPSTPGSSRTTRSSSSSLVFTAGPNTFVVPSSHGTPTSTGSEKGKGSRSSTGSLRSQRSTSGASRNLSGSQKSNSSSKRSESASPSPEEPTSRRRNLNFRSPLWQRDIKIEDAQMPPIPGRRNRLNLPLARPRRGGDANVFFNGDGEGEREATPVQEGAAYGDAPGRPGSSDGSSSSTSSDSGSEQNHGGGNDGNGPPSTPSSDSDLSNQELWLPLVGHQPERLPGRLSISTRNRHLTLLKERPGRLPTHTARSLTSPGFDWGDGGAWFHPAGSEGTQNVAREIFTPTGFKVIGQEVAQGIAELMYHENLINMLDGDGFGAEPEQQGVRQEVLYEFCAGGTLNKVILSRRPDAPVYGSEAPVVKGRDDATFLPTKEAVLGLPEDLVWHVLLSLLRATYWLHYRQQPAVHCAIDPANVFFTAPKVGDIRPLVNRYGLVKLGGFGKAVILPHRVDPDRHDHEEILERCEMFEPFVESGYDETAYEAPELLGMLGEDEISEERIYPGPCSDLWSIGATCFAMMTGKTIWDVLLERRFIERSLAPQGVERAEVHEKWRFHSYNERMDLLEPILRGEAVFGAALPDFYSAGLRQFVQGLLSLDPDVRGESAALVDEAEKAFAAISDGENGLQEMRRLWKRVTRVPNGRQELERAVREYEEVFGGEREGR